jgi:signal recognition particle subunit SRP54
VFEGLSDRLQGVFKELRGEGHLTEYHLEQALRQIRLSLLEADVALPVVRDFTARVKERAVGSKVTQQLSPAQEVTRIVRDELIALLGGAQADVALQGKPAVIMLVGLQGSGKTTSAGKLARLLKTRGRYSARDRRRPAAARRRRAARDARPADRRAVYSKPGATDPVALARDGVREAKQTGRDTVIVDTAGRCTSTRSSWRRCARLPPRSSRTRRSSSRTR